MKAIIIFVLIGFAVSLWLILRAHSQRPKINAQPDALATNVFADLRAKYFILKRTDVSIPAPSITTEPWGVIMEIAYPETIVTTAAFADNTASVLRSSGGGFFGGGSIESVRNAGEAFLKKAQRLQRKTTLTSDFPAPKTGYVVFYLRTDEGIYTASAPEIDLGKQSHPLAPLYNAGLRILHEYLQLQREQQK